MQKDLNLMTGRWWRWSHYEIRKGFIRRGTGARLEVYDPRAIWLRTRPPAKSSNQQHPKETPYQSALRLLRELEYRRPRDVKPEDMPKPSEFDVMFAPLTQESEAKLLEWVADYGLLGILPHCTLQVSLAQRRRAQVLYTRIGAGWNRVEIPIMGEEHSRPPSAITLPLRGAGPQYEPLDVTWARFFPDVPREQQQLFSYPQPLTDEFWETYAEPIPEFFSAMHALRELHETIRVSQSKSNKAQKWQDVHDALTSRPLAAEGLLRGLGPALDWSRGRQVQLRWVPSSLLAWLAAMMLEDLSYGRALICPACRRPFVSRAYQAQYCSERCRWTVLKRKQRPGRARRAKVAT
jgi:hypothetical protein